MRPFFRIVGPIREKTIIAAGQGVRIRRRLERIYGRGRWRKMKGIAVVEFPDGTQAEVELHWYEAHGIGQREFKIKRVLRWLE